MSVLILLLAGFVLIICLLYYLSQRKFDYWKKKNVPYLKPLPFFGNFKDYILLKTFYPVITRNICSRFSNAPYVGVYFGTEPALVVKDPEIIKLVLAKDFYYFNSREISNYTHKEITTQNLFFTYGDRWRLIRQNVSPLFSSAKMRSMFPIIKKCSDTLDAWLEEKVKISYLINVKDIMASYTIDCIGSFTFGVSTNTMSRDTTRNPFKIIGDKIFKPTTAMGLKLVWRSIWPAIFYGLKLKYIDASVTDFFNKLLTNVFVSRQYRPSNKNDFVDLSLSLKANKYVTGDSIDNMKTGDDKKITMKMDDEFLISNCVVMFAAGFETSASTLSYLVYELAKNKQAQAKAIEVVDRYWLDRREIGYECISDLPYLDACIDETLRLYPVLGVITREVVEDYTLPTGLHLDKGVRVHIPVYYLHHNPDHFVDPEAYRPERFYGSNKQNITPFSFLPFGEGPRICVGMRFAKLMMLTALATILRKYRLELADGTPRTLHFEPKTMVSQPKETIRLKFIPRT